jgi:ubiquitin-like modifier-activating enzyme ATG7
MCPSLLASFSVICFADLKRYKFTYLFAFPALHSEPAWTIASKPKLERTTGSSAAAGNTEALVERLTAEESTALVECVETWRYSVDNRQYGFFLAKKVKYFTPSSHADSNDPYQRPVTPGTPKTTLDFSWVIGSLMKYDMGFFDGVDPEDRFVCFADPSNYPTHPGWMLRNLLVLVHQRWKLNNVQILCYRDTQSQRHEARSIIMQLTTGSMPRDEQITSESTSPDLVTPQKMPKVTGWERNSTGKVASKIVNLSDYMDPQRLADQAVDLNLKLIKWRIAPGLNLDKIKETKCLLLGAGTLGSYVARNLLGWGVRKITFVDNGSVSFSNPVRQPLFDFKDCLGGGAKKADRAAEALTEIYPGVDSKGHVLSVPMAGHPVMNEAKTKADFDTLKQLVDEHDVIFLLMDTRESRWLPTVMGKAEGKIVMNAALGFDTFVVMRHGVKSSEASGKGAELGCYFCNDVVAPADVCTSD